MTAAAGSGWPPAARRPLLPGGSREIADIAAAGTVLAALALGVLTLIATITSRAPAPEIAATALLLAVCMPIYLRHIAFAVHAATPSGAGPGIAILAVLVFGAVPYLGVAWLASMHLVLVVLLLSVRLSLAGPLALAVVATVVPLALWHGASGKEALWLAVMTGMRVIAVYTLVWMVVALRQLRAANAALSEQAVTQERAQIAQELARTVQEALTQVAAAAARADEHASRGQEHLAAAGLARLATISRRGLDEARKLVRQYRNPVLAHEIASASALLAAAGITAEFAIPAQLPPHAQAALRASLRDLLAQQLRSGTGQHITVTARDTGGTWELECAAAPESVYG